MRRVLLPLCVYLGACMPSPQIDVPSRAVVLESTQTPVNRFATPHPVHTTKANSDIAQDFLDLVFKLESGRALPVFTRFEGPITVAVAGSPPPGLGSDLNRLIHRLRTEAQIDISLARKANANITIQAVTRKEIRRQLPQAACFVVPNVSSLAQYRAAKRTNRVNWTMLRERSKLAIFLPNDASPQEVRDCLHEELAQALGPLNDLYRLPDSVFNDDNVHTVLTGFDMLILRAYYAPELKNGMTKSQVAERIGPILARINPQGQNRSTRTHTMTPRAWINAIQSALGPGTGAVQRRVAAERALQIASAMGWRDHRRAFSHYAMGRLTQNYDADRARNEFVKAEQFYANSPDTELHRAYVASQLAAHALANGQGEEALRMIGPNIGVAARYENAALLSTLMLMRAEALEISGRVSEAHTVRLDSLGWARYGFGADWAVRAKLREIASLNPFKR